MKKKLFFLLTLLVCCIGQVWGEVTYTKMTSATSLDESAVYVIGEVDTYGCPTKTDGTSLSTKESDWVKWNAKNVDGGFVLYNGATYITVPSSNAWGSGTTGATLTTNSEGIVTGTDDEGKTRILVKNSSNAYLRWYKSGQTKAYLYKVNAGTTPTKTLKSIAVSGTPTKTSYYVGNKLDVTGLVVTGTYDDASTGDVTDNATWNFTPAIFDATGNVAVAVVATVEEISSPAYNVNVTVAEKPAPTYANTYTSGEGLLTTTGGTSASAAKVVIDETQYEAIKAGSSKVVGAIKMTVPAGTKTLHFHALGWNGETVEITVNGQTYPLTSDTGVSGNSPFTLTTDPSEVGYFTLDTNNATALEITFTATSGNRFVLFGVNAEAGEPSTDPSISASNVKIDADATSGEIAYTIKNPVAGKALTATTDADWITITQVTDEKVTFTTTANTEATERSADITLKYEGATDKVVTVTQKAAAVVLTTIDQIFAKATEAGSTAAEVSVKFDGWYVTGVKGSNAYATDGTKGFIIYGNGHGFVVGDALTGTVTCKVQLFNGSAELTQLTTSTEGLTVTPNHSISAVEKTIDQLSGINTGAVVTIKNVTYDGANFTDGTNAFLPYNTLMTLPAFEENGKYNITGVYLQYGGKKEILPRSEADIESLATTKYTITWSVNGTTTTEEVNEGAAIDFIPATVPAGYTADYVFRGWTTESTVDAEPTYVTEATATADITYYAVFAKKTITGGSGDYEKVTTTPDSWAGEYLLVYESGEGYGQTLSGNKTVAGDIKKPTAIDINNGSVEADETTEANAIYIAENADSGYLLQTKSGYYFYNTSSTSNGFSVSDNENTAAKYEVTLAIDTDGNAVITAAGSTLRYNVSSTIFQFYKPESVSGQKAVCLYKKQEGTVTYSDFCTVLPAGFELTIGETGYATFYDEVDRLIPNGMTAYYCKGNASGSLQPVEITTGVIPAETGVILEGKAATYMLVEGDGTAEKIEGNCLQGTSVDFATQDLIDEYERIWGTAPTIFVFSKVDDVLGFYKYVGSTLGAHKAFYATVSEAGINGFTLDFGGQTVGMGSVIRAANLKAGYDIQGRRINQMQKGINILNGKKIIK